MHITFKIRAYEKIVNSQLRNSDITRTHTKEMGLNQSVQKLNRLQLYYRSNDDIQVVQTHLKLENIKYTHKHCYICYTVIIRYFLV